MKIVKQMANLVVLEAIGVVLVMIGSFYFLPLMVFGLIFMVVVGSLYPYS